MNPNDVIESYVLDVMRRMPRKDRNDIGFELRDLLGEMLAERAGAETPDEATILTMLRDFGTPAEVAARYRPASFVIIKPEQTRSFVLTATIGLVLQWALTLPAVFDGQPLSVWWLTWGLGSFWWPGFIVTMTMIAAWIGHVRPSKSVWSPKSVDPERVNPSVLGFSVVWIAIAAALMTSLPWIAPRLPGLLPQIFAFDPEFLRTRAWMVIPLWIGQLAVLSAVAFAGRWSKLTRALDLGAEVAMGALLVWWLAAGDIFVSRATDDGAKGGLVLVLGIIVIDVGVKLYRRRTRIRTPKVTA